MTKTISEIKSFLDDLKLLSEFSCPRHPYLYMTYQIIYQRFAL